MEFQRLVRDLLAFSWEVSWGEVLTVNVKADLVITRREFGKPRTILVECKDHARALTQRTIDDIIARYSAALASRAADEVLIVSRCGLVAGAAAQVNAHPHLAHQTLAELEREVMDFDMYLRGLVAAYRERADGLPDYFVPLRTPDGDLLDDVVFGWIASPTERPMAIVASYGQGKSSFAARLAADLASEALSQVTARIPILIPLGEVAAEQSLEGLLGKALTTHAGVARYSWPAFDRLNRAGRFVVILDGFDEMRFSLSASSLRHNFGQIVRLATGEARLLVLGRPTAFTSDEEHLRLLHGTRQHAGRSIRVEEWPDFTEVGIAPLDAASVSEFVSRYFRWRTARAGGRLTRRVETDIARRQEQVASGPLRDLAQRPVQLKMLVEVLPQWKGSIERLDTATLYSEFIDQIIERDTDKRDRERFSTATRRQFAGDLALWLWQERGRMRIEPDTIPDSIVGRYMRGDDDREATLRSLTGGCFLDRRLGDTLVFPHRSFQEFLVAERILARLLVHAGRNRHLEPLSVGDADEAATEEVTAFLVDITGHVQMSELCNALVAYRGVLSSGLARLWARSPTVLLDLMQSDRRRIENVFERSTTPRCPWWPMLLARQETSHAQALFLPALVSTRMDREDERDYAVVLLACVFMSGDANAVRAALSHALGWRYEVLASGHERFVGDRVLDTEENMGLRRGGVLVERIPWEVLEMARRVTYSAKRGTLDMRGAYGVLAHRLERYCLVSPERHAKRARLAAQMPPEIRVGSGDPLLDTLQSLSVQRFGD